MNSSRLVLGSAIVATIALTTSLYGQGVVTQWNFNGKTNSLNPTNPAPSSGVGAAALIGGTDGKFNSGAIDGGSTDTATSNNNGWTTDTYPAINSGSGTAGTQFGVATTGQSNLVFRFDLRHENQASRFVRVEYTTNGTTWTSAGVFEANLGGQQWYNNRTVDFSGVSGVNNNANFAVRVVTIFDPANNTSYSPSNPNSNYNPSGSLRYDMVTLTGGHVWVGGGTNNQLGTGGNYVGGGAPTGADTVLFNSSGGSNTDVSTAAGGNEVAQIIFQSGAPAYTIAGSGILTVGAGLVNNAANTQTISAPFVFGNQNQVFNNGSLVLSGNVAFANGLILQGGGKTALGTVVNSSNGTLSVTPGHTLILNGTFNESLALSAGANLAGTGTLSDPVTISAGSAIRGGDPLGTTTAAHVGTLNANGHVTIESTSTTNGVLQFEANRTSAGNATSSLIQLADNQDFRLNPGAGNKFTIELVVTGGTNPLVLGETYTVTLADTGNNGRIQLNGVDLGNGTIAQSNYVLTSSAFGFDSNHTLTTTDGGRTLQLTFTPVPEPATVVAIAAGALGVGGVVRRVRRGTLEGTG